MRKFLFYFLIFFLLASGVSAVTLDDASLSLSYDNDTIIDQSDSNMNFTDVGSGRTNNNCILNSCRQYNSTDSDYTVVGTKSNYSFTGVDDDFSIMGWIYLEGDDDNDYIMDNRVVTDGWFFSIDTGASNLRLAVREGGNLSKTVATAAACNGLSTTTLHHIVVVANKSGDNLGTFYVDGVECSSYTDQDAMTFSTSEQNPVHIGGNTDLSDFFNGTIDQLMIYPRALTGAEITASYNSGTGVNPYAPPAPPENVSYAYLALYDLYDNSSLPDGTVCGMGTVTNISVSGVCYFVNQTTGFNYSVGGVDYFAESGTATENETINVYLYGAFVELSAFDVLGNTVLGFNVSAGTQSNESFSGSTYLLLPPNATTEVNFSRSGWFDALLNVTTGGMDTGSFNVSSFHDNEFLINASDALSGDAVTSFSVNASNGSDSFLLNTSTGSVLFPLIQGYYWNFFIDAEEFAFSNVTLAANASENDYEFSLLPQNSIFLYFYDLTTLEPILANVSVTFSKDNFSLENSSTSGEMIASDLDAGTWTIDASSPLYESAQYFVTVTARSFQDVDVLLLNSTSTGETVLTIKEADTADNIPDATVTLQTKIAGNWVTFDQKISDFFGATFFQLGQGEEYQMIIEADDFFTKTGIFVRTKSSYIITLSSKNTQNFDSYLNDFSYTVTPSILNLSNTVFSITTSSPDGRIEWFSVSTLLNGSTTLSNVTGSPSGGTASINLNLSSYGGQYVSARYLVKSVSFDTPFELNRHWYILDIDAGNYTFVEFMEYYEDDDNGFGLISRIMLLTFAAVILSMIVGLAFGVEAALLISSAVYLAGGYFGWVHWSIVIVVVTVLLGGLFIKGGRL